MRVFLFLFSIAALLQAGAAVADAAAQEIVREPGAQTFSFHFENDLFADSDAQYTNGMRLSWMSPDLKALGEAPGLPVWLHRLVSRLNAFERVVVDDDTRQFNIGFAAGQLMFTPDDTQSVALVRDDRPYAGWLFGAISLVSRTNDVADTVEIQAGMVGPASLAEHAQRFVHDVRDLPKPRGWDNQLGNEPGLVIYLERKWRALDWQHASGLGMDFIPHAGVAVGNVATYGALGTELRLGWNLPDDFGTSLIRPGGHANAPGIPTRGGVRARAPGVYAFAALAGRAVGRNIFLDGNTFEDSHDVDKKNLVGDLVIGAAVIYGSLKVSFAQVFRTREFDGQSQRHRFGSVNVSVSF